jgi:hypothetical protein
LISHHKDEYWLNIGIRTGVAIADAAKEAKVSTDCFPLAELARQEHPYQRGGQTENLCRTTAGLLAKSVCLCAAHPMNEKQSYRSLLAMKGSRLS